MTQPTTQDTGPSQPQAKSAGLLAVDYSKVFGDGIGLVPA